MPTEPIPQVLALRLCQESQGERRGNQSRSFSIFLVAAIGRPIPSTPSTLLGTSPLRAGL